MPEYEMPLLNKVIYISVVKSQELWKISLVNKLVDLSAQIKGGSIMWRAYIWLP